LLNNAIKFTHKGHVKLSVTLDTIKNNQTSIADIQFKIIDTGIGIKDEDLKELFTPFRQLHQQHKVYGGTGLGLLISKQLVELMGGKINVFSKEGVGSTFMFNLPLALPKDQTINVKARRQRIQLTDKQKETLSRVKILVAEDNIINRTVLMRLLKDIGFDNVDTAVDGKNTVQKWEEAQKSGIPFNLVFMDCVMPELDGFEATQAIRDREKELSIQPCTIVAVTANALSEDKQRCLESGMDDYLSKPIRVEQLCKLLSSYTKIDELFDAYA
jgi:CheY-like chemotaxis protein